MKPLIGGGATVSCQSLTCLNQ
uniref:Uncharacterized protein n=1 Tax=Anguilla anguilla TaxID=7936 RepID=A0A0E9WBJ0_ANGAN